VACAFDFEEYNDTTQRRKKHVNSICIITHSVSLFLVVRLVSAAIHTHTTSTTPTTISFAAVSVPLTSFFAMITLWSSMLVDWTHLCAPYLEQQEQVPLLVVQPLLLVPESGQLAVVLVLLIPVLPVAL